MASELEMFGAIYLVLLALIYRTSLFGVISRTIHSFHSAPRVTEDDWAFVASVLGFKDLANILVRRRIRSEVRPRPFRRLFIFAGGFFAALLIIQVPVTLTFSPPVFGSLNLTPLILSTSGAVILLASTIIVLGKPSRDWRVRIDEPFGVWDEYVPKKLVRDK